MAQLLSSVFSGIAGSLLRSFNEQQPANSVLEVKAEEYAKQPVIDRDDCITLYGPFQEKYDVVLQIPFQNSPHNVYSLYRCSDRSEARKHFEVLKDRIPVLLDSREEFCTKNKLQSVCNLIQEHPTWTLAHLAAHMGIVECFHHKVIQSQINISCQENGQTPLQLAIVSEKPKVVQVLLDLDARLDIPDGEGNTVYHLAAKTTKEMIQMLINKSAYVINNRNKAGHTALHFACLADKPECVKALIYAGADVNATGTVDGEVVTSTTGSAKEVMEMYPRHIHAKDMKHGGTPLHWAMSPEVVEALVELGCTVDARDFKGGTPLHTMISRSRLQCAIALLGYGADVNACNDNLDTPLHLAVKGSSKPLVQALLIFGADVNKVNRSGDSPRHIVATSKQNHSGEVLHILHAVGARRCEFGKQNCMEGCKHEGRFDGIQPTSTPIQRDRSFFDELLAAATVATAISRLKRGCDVDGDHHFGYRVLCLDGGGIRGLVLIQLLVAIEDVMGRPLKQCFDWISGTSTGGILALLIATGRSAKYCQSVYFRLKNKVFVGIRPYDSESLERFLQKELGEQTKMSDVQHPKVAVTGVLADRHPADLHLFRNYASPLQILGIQGESQFHPTLPPEEQLMWRAGRASGAAPTYFRALGRFVDGGLIANNPTLDMLTEIHEYNCALRAVGQESEVKPITCVVSLGTGKPPVVPVNAIDVFCPQSVWDAAKMAFGMSALGNLLIDQATASDGRVVDRARAWCNMIEVPYFRFNPDLGEDVALDETKDEVLVNMLWETMVYMRSKKKELADLKSLLNM